jgi:hypothetical protein
MKMAVGDGPSAGCAPSIDRHRHEITKQYFELTLRVVSEPVRVVVRSSPAEEEDDPRFDFVFSRFRGA